MSGIIGVSPNMRSGVVGANITGEVLLDSQSASGNPSDIDITNVFSDKYRDYKLVCSNLIPNSNSGSLLFRFIKDDDSILSSAHYRGAVGGVEKQSGGSVGNTQAHGHWNATSAKQSPAGGDVSADVGTGGCNITLTIHNPYSSIHTCSVTSQSGMMRQGGDVVHASTGFFVNGGGTRTDKFTGIRLFWDSSYTFAYGHVTMYGYRK